MNRKKLNEDLKNLEDEKIITQNEHKQIGKILNANLDYYLQHQDIEFLGLEKMFFETIRKFEDIKINRPIYALIVSNFNNISIQVLMRNFPIKQENYSIQSKLNEVMHHWFENYQTDSEKITDLISQINKEKQHNYYPDISSSEYDEIISSLTHIKKDATISNHELKNILTKGMLKYGNKSNSSNLSILNIYSGINRIKKLEIDEKLRAIYQKNWTAPKEPTYAEIKQQVSLRFTILLEDGMITQQEFDNSIKTIIKDVEFCENNTNKEKIKAQLLSGLKKLKSIGPSDTEDREAISEWYYILSQKTEIDIKDDLNSWLYGFGLGKLIGVLGSD